MIIDMTDEDIFKMYNGIRNVALHGEIDYYRWMHHLAKIHDFDYSEFLQYMRDYAKSKLTFTQNIKHYHGTSINNFKSIIENGALLSRDELELRGVDTSKFGWSSSRNVQFTRDYYDEQGNLIRPGLTNHRVGNINYGVTLVFGPQLFKVNNYDCFSQYPTVSNASIKDNCIAILADSEVILNEIKNILIQNNMTDIPVMLKSNWDINTKIEENVKTR